MLAVLAAGLQAIGPMVALYGAGAQIERLRIRLSLRQPGLAVDVADDYGLSRWARLTVDVSGVYLQLVATLLLCLIGMLNGAEFLHLTVTLLTLNMLRLLLPFGRAGTIGCCPTCCWCRSRCSTPSRRSEADPGRPAFARVLPPLKRWGWVTIGLYLLATAVVIVVGVSLLAAAPTVIATMLVALVIHISDTLGALGDRDVVGFFEGLFQVTVLAITEFVLAVVIVVSIGNVLAGVWTWSQASGRRRMVAGFGAVVSAVLVLLFWMPLPHTTSAGLRTFRPLLGTPYRSLSPISRGTIFDLFAPSRTTAHRRWCPPSRRA